MRDRDPILTADEAASLRLVAGMNRDDRVTLSLGMELRPPFPQGFKVEQVVARSGAGPRCVLSPHILTGHETNATASCAN